MSIKEQTNIIIVGFNLFDKEAECLDHVVRHSDSPYLLTFFNNYGNNYTLTELWNYLIGKSPCKYICLLNNDTKVYPFWLSRLIDTLEKNKTIGLVGPSTNCCHSPQSTIKTYEAAFTYTDQVEIMKDPISGFCLLFKKELWEKLGGFDKRFALYGQESDFIDRAKKLGYSSAWRKDSFVFHHGEASVKVSGVNVEQERQKARDLYWKNRK